jgi:hypothetical protein
VADLRYIVGNQESCSESGALDTLPVQDQNEIQKSSTLKRILGLVRDDKDATPSQSWSEPVSASCLGSGIVCEEQISSVLSKDGSSICLFQLEMLKHARDKFQCEWGPSKSHC